ncbi:MAG: hypothetical protein OEM39_10035, partial [Acidimicrobiia bacterium]|nr:hypothetical protein [Acidimicrobiia bacterium]
MWAPTPGASHRYRMHRAELRLRLLRPPRAATAQEGKSLTEATIGPGRVEAYEPPLVFLRPGLLNPGAPS